jgi:hypothetical protein
VLLALVGCGILLPLVIVSWYMLSSNKFAGPNRIMQETLAFYFHSKYSIKESQVRRTGQQDRRGRGNGQGWETGLLHVSSPG